MLLIMAGALGLEQVLQKRPNTLLSMFGDTSYSMYLIHPFVLVAGMMVMNKLGLSNILGGWFCVIVLFIGSTLAGWVLYEYVETNIAKYIKKQSVSYSKVRLSSHVVSATDS